MAIAARLFLLISGALQQQRIFMHASRVLPSISSVVRPAVTPSNVVVRGIPRISDHIAPSRGRAPHNQQQSAAAAAVSVSRLPRARHVAQQALQAPAASMTRISSRFAGASVARLASEKAGENEQLQEPARKANEEAVAAQNGMAVAVFYSIFVNDTDIVVDSNMGKDPLVFNVGQGMVTDVIDKGVVGMRVGESKALEFGTDQPLFGEYQEGLTRDIPRDQIPPESLRVGAALQLQENTPPVFIREIKPFYVELDANHPAAGKACRMVLTLAVILPENVEASA